MTKRMKWILAGAGIVVLGGAIVAFKSKDKPQEEGSGPFRLGKSRIEDLQVSVREVGVVDPLLKVDVKSAVSGRVTKLRIREGATVKNGDVLAEVEPDVTQAQSLADVQSGVTQAELRLRDVEKEYVSQKALLDSGLIGREQFRDVETRKQLADENLKAARARVQIVQDHGIPVSADGSTRIAQVSTPMSGVVIKRGIELGETVTSGVNSFSSGTVLFTVADLDSLIIRVNLNEVDIGKVRVGQPVRVTLDAFPQKAFDGKVRFVAPAAKLLEKIKVFEVEIALDKLDEAFRTGMSANVEILGERREKALSIPLEALQRKDGAPVVYRLKKTLTPQQLAKAKEGLSGRTKFTWLSDHWAEYFDAVPVKAGLATLERVEVLAGLRTGDEVALEDPTRKKIEKDDENN